VPTWIFAGIVLVVKGRGIYMIEIVAVGENPAIALLRRLVE
jgi:hypothetical protein